MFPQEKFQPAKNESLFEYWVSFWPVAPLFGVRWRFAPDFPLNGAAGAKPAAQDAQTTGAAEAALAQAEDAALKPDAPAEEERAAEAAPEAPDAQDEPERPAEAAEAAEEETVLVEPLEADPAYDAAAAQVERARPDNLLESRPDHVDDLKRLRGVGPKLEAMLNEMGIYRFEQIASFDQANLAWVDDKLAAFKGRPYRDDWVEQAQALLRG